MRKGFVILVQCAKCNYIRAHDIVAEIKTGQHIIKLTDCNTCTIVYKQNSSYANDYFQFVEFLPEVIDKLIVIQINNSNI